MTDMDLVEQVLAGKQRAIAHAITLIENNGSGARRTLAAIYPHTGQAHVIGVTGPPGTGKSTLVNELTKECRRRGRTVGIISVDPTSPFSGGALLGDRVRMKELSGDAGVFIRSMATRGHLGGLARATANVIKVLDASGKDLIFVETVGAGQGEVEIAQAAHTVILVEAPGLGDDIQAIKAGITEIADIFVVNKADREGAENTALTLQLTLELDQSQDGWCPPILKTIALYGKGIEPVVDAVENHITYLKESGRLQLRERERIRRELMSILQDELLSQFLAEAQDERVETLIKEILERHLDPYSAAASLLEEVGHKAGPPP